MLDVESLVSIFGCWMTSLPIKYLGLPLGASYKNSYTIWNGIVEKNGMLIGGLKAALFVKRR